MSLQKKELDRLMDRINQQIQYGSVIIDKPVHNDLVNMMKCCIRMEKTDFVYTLISHMKSAIVSSSKGRRWYPLVIKCCLYIQHLSSKTSATLELLIFLRLVHYESTST